MADERRSCPRYSLNCDVQVVLPDESVFATGSTHFSRTGIELVCQAALIVALQKQQRFPYACRVEFSLPWHRHRFVLETQVVIYRRLSQQQYVLVLMLRHQDEEQELLLDSLLLAHATSVTTRKAWPAPDRG